MNDAPGIEWVNPIPAFSLSFSSAVTLLELCPLNTFAGARRQSMLWMMATTGIRRNEMWMLKKGDLDWDNSVIRVIYGKGV